MRRPFALALASLLSLTFLVVPVGRSSAQEPPVHLTLLQQTPQWNDPRHPTVTMRFRAENTGEETFGDLRIGVTLYAPALSRTGYEEAMAIDVPGASVIVGGTRPRIGELAPGDTRDFEVPIDLPLSQFSADQSLVYPLTVDLRSHFRSLAAIRTPVIYLVRQPLYPLSFVWTFVLHAQLTMRPDGIFESPGLETSISRGGRLAGQLSALDALARSGVGVDVVVSPLLVYQLLQMRDGYRVIDHGAVRIVEQGQGASVSAAQALVTLRAIAHARNVELSTLPYSEPLLPALTSGGLARDLAVQVQRGRALVSATLGQTTSTAVFRPPRSALDGLSLDELPGQGISTLLLDPDSVRRNEDLQGFAPSPLVSLAAQNATLTGIVADPAVQTMLGSGTAEADPILAAQQMLGELAEIWLQHPGEVRALAMMLGEWVEAPGAFYPAIARGIESAPWLAKRTASKLLNEQTFHAPGAVTGVADSSAAFSNAYVDAIKRAGRRIETLRTMLVQPSALPSHLDQLLLLGEAQRFVGDEPSGSAYTDRVVDTTSSIFGAVEPRISQTITLTSSSIRDVPIAVDNSAAMPLRATIRLSSPHLVSPVERTRVFRARSTSTVSVDLQLKTTGRFDVLVDVLAPSGRAIAHETLVVRSTAYNRVALVITLGAAALAILVWARRFVPRRNG